MAYTDQNIDVWISTNAGSLTTGIVDPLATGANNFRPGYQPYQCSAIYALILTQLTVTPATAVIKYRPTIGSATGEFVIGTLILPIAAVAGSIIYKKVDSIRMPPGGELVTQITAASTAGQAQFGALINPTWDAPGNNTKMIASA